MLIIEIHLVDQTFIVQAKGKIHCHHFFLIFEKPYMGRIIDLVKISKIADRKATTSSQFDCLQKEVRYFE